MDATTLAKYELATQTRQTLRRGNRTIYVRFYEVPHGSSPPLPEAGAFLPGETSGACVMSDGVTISPVSRKDFVGVSVVVTAQQAVYEDLSSGGTFPLGEYFVKRIKGELSSGDSQYNRWRFEVPYDSWSGLTVPNKGAATPAALGGGGIILSKDVDYGSVPGFVVCTLVCGWRWTWFGSLTRVSCRTVSVTKKLTVALDGTTPLAGPVAGTTYKQRWAIAGDDSYEETYVQISIVSIVSSIPSGWQGSNFKKRNAAAVTIRGITYTTGHVLYVGGASEDVPAEDSPTGSAAYKLSLVLLAAGQPWPLTVARYKETKEILETVVLDVDNAEVGKSRTSIWVRDEAATDSPAIRAEFDMVTALAALPS